MTLTRIELEQLNNSREYQDRLAMGVIAESGVDFQSDFNYAISQLRSILYGTSPSGIGNWYDVPGIDLNQIVSSLNAVSGTLTSHTTSIAELQGASGVLNTRLNALLTYVGSAIGDTTPSYSSIKYLTQSQDLTDALGQLDAALFAVSGNLNSAIGSSNVTLSQAFDNGSGIMDVDAYDASMRLGASRSFYFHDDTGANPAMTISLSQILAKNFGNRGYLLVASQLAPGDSIALPGSITYTTGDSKFRNLRVYRNGALQLPGSGVISTDENYNDYRENNSTSIITNRTIQTSEILEFHVNG